MRIVEKSPDHLRISNANTDKLWSEWKYVLIIIAILLIGIGISAWVIRPACWSGVEIGCVLLFLLVLAFSSDFDTEFCFDRAGNQLQVIQRPRLIPPRHRYYSLSDITEVRVAKVRSIHGHNYPGHDYDDADNGNDNVEIEPSIAKPTYRIELSMRSGSTLIVDWGNEDEAIQLGASIAEFLGLTFTTA